MLHQDAHRALEHATVDVVRAEQDQCRAQSIDSAIDGGFFRSRLRIMFTISIRRRATVSKLGHVQPHDLHLALDVGVVEPRVVAAALQGLGQLACVVGVSRTSGCVVATIVPSSGIEIWKSDRTSQHRLELLVGLVDLVDQQHDRLLLGDRSQQRPRHQEVLREDVLLHVLPPGAGGLGLDPSSCLR